MVCRRRFRVRLCMVHPIVPRSIPRFALSRRSAPTVRPAIRQRYAYTTNRTKAEMGEFVLFSAIVYAERQRVYA